MYVTALPRYLMFFASSTSSIITISQFPRTRTLSPRRMNTSSGNTVCCPSPSLSTVQFQLQVFGILRALRSTLGCRLLPPPPSFILFILFLFHFFFRRSLMLLLLLYLKLKVLFLHCNSVTRYHLGATRKI